MRKIALFLLMLWVDMAFGQTTFVSQTIAVPQIAIGGDLGGQNYVTLIQVVNNNSAVTTGHVALFSDNGSPLSALFDGQGPQATFDITLAAGETRQVQVTLNGAITPGWMQITYSPTSAMTSVILQFRSGTDVLSEVGVDPTFSVIAGTDFPAETDATFNTGIAIANPNSAAAYVLVTLWNASNGTIVGGVVVSLPPNGHIARFLTEIFPTVPNIGQIRTKISLDSCSTSACNAAGGGGVIATALRLSGDQFTTIPVVERQSAGETTRILPQVAFGGPAGGLNMKTVLYLTTNVTTGVFGTADIFDNDGNPLAASADGRAPASSLTFTVAGNRVSRVVLSGDQTLRSGWIRLTLPDSVHLIANAVFQTYSGATLVSEASVLESPSVTKGLIFVKSQSGRVNTGIAIANSQVTPNTVTLELFDRAGFIAGVRDVTLPPNGHLAQFVTELFPQTSGADFDGALSIHSATSFSAIALRVSGDKNATLPVASDGMYRPYINALRVTSAQRSPGRVNFTIDVTDLDADLVSSSSVSVSADAYLDFGSAGVDFGPITLDGTALLNRAAGTISGSFQPPHVTSAIPAGYKASLFINIYDSQRNESNFVGVPVTF